MITAGILAFFGGVFDFQTMKAEVRNLKKTEKNHTKTLKAIGIIVCYYANKDKMPNAREICKDAMGGN